MREPVYSNGKNYSGRSPFPWEHEEMSKLMEETFKLLSTAKKDCLIVPCGQIVSTALMVGLLDTSLYNNVLFGFPHPSPLNGHARREFEENFNELRKRTVQILSIQSRSQY